MRKVKERGEAVKSEGLGEEKKQDQRTDGEVTLHSDRGIRRGGKRTWKGMMKHTQ